MGLFDIFKGPNINDGLVKYHQLKYAILLDIRSEEAYAKGHIPGAVNVPFKQIARARYELGDLHAPVFVYGWYHNDAKDGVIALKALGFEHITALGDCDRYTGEIEVGLPGQQVEVDAASAAEAGEPADAAEPAADVEQTEA